MAKGGILTRPILVTCIIKYDLANVNYNLQFLQLTTDVWLVELVTMIHCYLKLESRYEWKYNTDWIFIVIA